MDLKDQKVQFKIRDVYHPDPIQVLLDLYGDDLLTGKVVALSDSGMQKDAFVVVEVGERPAVEIDVRAGDPRSH